MILRIKKFLRRLGLDIVRYHPFYEAVVLPLNIHTILDIGANVGNWSKEMRSLFPKSQIYAFEPLGDCYQSLISKMGRDPRFKAWNTALGDYNGKAEIQRSSFHPSSSFLKMLPMHERLYPRSRDSKTESVEIRRLDDIKDLILEKNILIKMDVQGYEDKVILGGQKIIQEAAVLIIETAFLPLYENQPLFDDIYKMLGSLGFSYYGSVERHYSRLSDKLIYEDSVFIKKELIGENEIRA